MEFEWDIEKSEQNQEKHGVSFDESVVIWETTRLEVENLAYSEDGEKRSATIGWIETKLYVAIWTKRHEKIRIISVRRARKNEEEIFFKKIRE